jgi:hypothetical protein
MARNTTPMIGAIVGMLALVGGISFFPCSSVPARSSGEYWFVSTSDHNAGRTGTTVYSISTSLTSTTAADSIRVIGTIDYYH